MTKPLRLFAATALVSLTSCATQTVQIDAGVMFASVNGDIALQNSTGSLDLGQAKNDLDGNLGVGDTEPGPYVRVTTDYGRHRFRAQGFGIDAEGSGTLSSNFGDLMAGTPVTTSMEFYAIGANWAYELLKQEHYRLGVGVALEYMALDLDVRNAVGFVSVRTDVLVPMPYAEIEGFLGPATVGINAGVMSADLGNGRGEYFDTEAYFKFRPVEAFELQVGYRYIYADVSGTADSRDFKMDIDVQGAFIGGGIRF
jgi:hypothetical protein